MTTGSRFAGKRCLVTGAASGIGRATAAPPPQYHPASHAGAAPAAVDAAAAAAGPLRSRACNCARLKPDRPSASKVRGPWRRSRPRMAPASASVMQLAITIGQAPSSTP